jgi:uncharacterized membrane protein
MREAGLTLSDDTATHDAEDDVSFLEQDIRAVRSYAAVTAWSLLFSVLCGVLGGLHAAGLFAAADKPELRQSEAYWTTFLGGAVIALLIGTVAWGIVKAAVSKD